MGSVRQSVRVEIGSVREAIMRLDLAHQSLAKADQEMAGHPIPSAGFPDLTEEDVERGRLDVWVMTARDVLALHDVILRATEDSGLHEMVCQRVLLADGPLR